MSTPTPAKAPFWSRSAQDLLAETKSTPAGLSSAEAAARLARLGPNLPHPPEKHPALRIFLAQWKSPITLLLLATAIFSAFAGEETDAVIILIILIGSTMLGFWQENRTANAIAELFAMIRLKSKVLRDGREQPVPVEDIVPGDVVSLRAGDLIPADCRLLEANSLNVDEASLTGESYPSSKDPAPVAADAEISKRDSALFQGTHMLSGSGTALVIATGINTQYGALAGAVEKAKPESEFERGIHRFGYLLLQMTAVLVIIIFGINLYLGRGWLDVFMFSLALAVGLTPQMLPAIVSITLAYGARRMAQKQVLVRRLVAIEDFGGMSVLCTDKTGTLTEGNVAVRDQLNVDGSPARDILRLAWLNADLQTGFDNPIDTAIKGGPGFSLDGITKLAEVPYDFARRRLSILIKQADGSVLLVCKGAVADVLAVSTEARKADGGTEPIAGQHEQIGKLVADAGEQGLRCIAVATRKMDSVSKATVADEKGLVFEGILTLADPPKPNIKQTLEHLRSLGLTLKIITGDNHRVASAIAREVGMNSASVVTGAQMASMSDTALRVSATNTDIFAEVDPNQKQRIILALKAGGHSVGYMGDGINDAPALKAADVGISVDTAVDITREAADIVLLRKDLDVLADGIAEGRRAFANTLKYVFVTTSANFGNMFSLAGASMMAKFLPMLPKQILLLNMLSDMPAMTIATDNLDPELVASPRRWDVKYILDFMIVFGLISSFFDYATFGMLLLMKVGEGQFRTAWFLESNLTEIFVLLVIRTARNFYQSPPSRPMLYSTLGVAVVTFALPYIPGTQVLGFAPLSAPLMLGVIGITAGLVIASEIGKRYFFRSHKLDGGASLRAKLAANRG